MTVAGYVASSFCHEGITHQVYRRGQGPAVIVMHEIFGLRDEVIHFASDVAKEGFTVFVPCLFGDAGDAFSQASSLASVARACIRREFAVLAARNSSPITNWLRALSRSVYEELGGRGVGAIGMCLTGNFALSMMVDEHLMAPVLSQPSMPFSIGKNRKAALHVSDEELEVIQRRTREGVKVLGLRFSEDKLCTKERFETLRNVLGDGFEGIEIDSSRGNSDGISRRAHSVLTGDLVDEEGHPTAQARDRVLSFLRERLLPEKEAQG